jgi:hypothetical protein
MGRPPCKRCGKGGPEARFFDSWPEVCTTCRTAHQRAYYVANRDKYITQAAAYRDAQRTRISAASAVAYAIRMGQLEPEPCFTCGRLKAEAHHASYARDMWLMVTWLCRSCHRQVHQEAA